MSKRVLVVEDESSVAEAVAYALHREGFETMTAGTSQAALRTFEEYSPDVVLLDLMLPGLSGWQLLPLLRKKRSVPIIMVTARAEESDRVAGLEMGADDYITKPFSMRELIARVRAVLRRAPADSEIEETPVLNVHGVSLDRERREVMVDGRPVDLAPKEFELLAYLMSRTGRVRTRDDILMAVWGQNEYIDPRTVDVHVRWLRKKIETDPAEPRRLLTVRGVGYRFADAT